MLKSLTQLFKRVHFKFEMLNLLSFFIGMLASAAMISFIIYHSYQWALISGIGSWLGFSFLFKRHKEIIYREITVKLLQNYDQNKVKDVLEIIHE
ncbi:hypothetical protein [Sporohalobacter salinus]|uniref:hypothetical protein n=1 Tax=Sporohalobacter salinus TaxID=1494606 RepID=UPI001961F499|nr:hypothetical protein [Sporohalobacter salinus]MBM7624892.1 hypothetical protein [Sporohalobacter salinus]